MPIYQFKCPKCKKRFEVALRMKDYNCPQKCIRCDVVMDKQVHNVGVVKEGLPFFSHALGQEVSGNSEFRKKMKSKGFNKDLAPY